MISCPYLILILLGLAWLSVAESLMDDLYFSQLLYCSLLSMYMTELQIYVTIQLAHVVFIQFVWVWFGCSWQGLSMNITSVLHMFGLSLLQVVACFGLLFLYMVTKIVFLSIISSS